MNLDCASAEYASAQFRPIDLAPGARMDLAPISGLRYPHAQADC